MPSQLPGDLTASSGTDVELVGVMVMGSTSADGLSTLAIGGIVKADQKSTVGERSRTNRVSQILPYCRALDGNGINRQLECKRHM